MNLTAAQVALGGFGLSRLTYTPGKMLSLQVDGIAQGKDGSHANAEYQAHFFRPADVHIEFTCSPVAKLRKTQPVEILGPSMAGGAQRIRIVFETGMIEINTPDSNCSELRYDKFSDADERRYRSQP